jgi:lysine 2,3-aminomutase
VKPSEPVKVKTNLKKSVHSLEGTSRSGKVHGEEKIVKFLTAVVPSRIPSVANLTGTITRESFITDVLEAIISSSMSIRISPYILSCINWNDPVNDPLRRQFLLLDSETLPAHPKSKLDSLNEKNDSPVEGLVHRYPTKVLLLGKPIGLYMCLVETQHPQIN